MDARRRHWPLADLVLETPRLVLRPDDDDGLGELADAALAGVHPPGEMPFFVPWTDTAGTPGFERGVMQYAWANRASLRPEAWHVSFLVRRDGRVIGTQSVEARDFAAVGEVETGSWLTMAAQGDGVGTEMRAAVLEFAFDYLDAHAAITAAFADNAASNAVSRRLGYAPDGIDRRMRREEAATLHRFRLTPEAFARPPWILRVTGAEACREMLGAARSLGTGDRPG